MRGLLTETEAKTEAETQVPNFYEHKTKLSYDWFKIYLHIKWGIANGCLLQSIYVPNIVHTHKNKVEPIKLRGFISIIGGVSRERVCIVLLMVIGNM